MRFKLDENLGRRGAEPLRQSGHDVMTVRDQNLCGRPDAELIGICTAEGRCLVTLDFDFADTLTYPPDRYAGIVLLRLPRHPVPGDIDSAIKVLLDGLSRRVSDSTPRRPVPDDVRLGLPPPLAGGNIAGG